MHQRAGLDLPSSNPSGVPDRSAILRARGRNTGPHSLAHSTARRWALLRSHCDLRRIQSSTQSRKEIKALSLSSNRKQLRYGDRSKIFRWFPNGMARTMLGMAW